MKRAVIEAGRVLAAVAGTGLLLAAAGWLLLTPH